MNEELNVAFKDYVEKFKVLSIPDKRIEIINSMKELNGVVEALSEIKCVELENLKSKEILDFNNGLESEDDFLEALFVYVENLKNLIGQYFNL